VIPLILDEIRQKKKKKKKKKKIYRSSDSVYSPSLLLSTYRDDLGMIFDQFSTW
jgi:predicted nucleic acid-binding protein